MFLNHFTRRGNALLLTTIILALVLTGMLSLTDQLLGRKQMADFSRVMLRAQETADNVAETLCDRINSNSSLLTTDFASSGTSLNQLDNWLTRGFVKGTSEVTSVKGIWLNNCVVYWRLEPVTLFDRTITDTTGDGVIGTADVTQNGGQKYMTNRSLDIAGSATTPAHSAAPSGDNRLENSGLLFFELTVDAFAMSAQNRMSANPLDAATNASSSHSGDRSPFHAQIKKRVLVKNISLFRYVIFYSATGPTGDFELYQSPNVTVVGAVHTNGAAYIGTAADTSYKVIFGSNPAASPSAYFADEPPLRSIPVTAVDGLFCMRKYDMYSLPTPILNPMNLARGSSQGNDYQGSFPYINSAKLKYENLSMGGLTLVMPTLDTSASLPVVAADSGPFTIARDSRPLSTGTGLAGGTPLNGYDPKLVRDGPNRQLRTIDITRQLNMNGYRPLEPFALVGPNIPLKQDAAGTYSILTGTNTGIFAADMILFRNGTNLDVSATQGPGTVALPTINFSTESAFDDGATPARTIPGGAAIVPAPISRAYYNATNRPFGIDIAANDIFSHLGTYIIGAANGSPGLGTYIRNPLGLNAVRTRGVGITILERGSQARIRQWPSGRIGGAAAGRLGEVSWDPPCAFSTSEVTYSGAALWRYYDSNNDEIIDPDLDTDRDGDVDEFDNKFANLDSAGLPNPDTQPNGQMTAFLMDYCEWMRSNYVVYFGVNEAGTALVDITDQFFSVPTGATGLESLLAQEDVFKDRREARWRQSSANNYTDTGAGDFDAVRVNVLTLNIGAIDNFIRTTALNRLDPAVAVTNAALASSRFNGTIYAARTPRYTAPAVPPVLLGASLANLNANMFTYRVSGTYDPIAPLGFNQTWAAQNNAYQQKTALPVAAGDTIAARGALLYPVVGSSTTAKVNGYPHPTPESVPFGSRDSWSCYPLLKRVRVRNASTIDWGGRRANGRSIGLTMYTPNVCYLQGNFNVVADSQGKFPACALYCDGLVALSTNWNDGVANGLATDAQFSGVATATVHRLCLVIHNNPTDLGNIATPANDVHEPGGSGGVHNVIKFLENWSTIDWAFIGSLVVLDRARYTRGYLGNQDVYNPPKRHYNFNEDLKIELPPFPDVINEVFIW